MDRCIWKSRQSSRIAADSQRSLPAVLATRIAAGCESKPKTDEDEPIKRDLGDDAYLDTDEYMIRTPMRHMPSRTPEPTTASNRHTASFPGCATTSFPAGDKYPKTIDGREVVDVREKTRKGEVEHAPCDFGCAKCRMKKAGCSRCRAWEGWEMVYLLLGDGTTRDYWTKT